MKNYFDLLKKLAPLDRCHCGPEMEEAYQILKSYYQSTRLIRYPCGVKIKLGNTAILEL